MSIEADEADWKAMVADLSEGVLLIRPDGTLTFANTAALAMHGVSRLDELGGSIAGFHKRFILSNARSHPLDPKQDPLARAARGEAFSDMVIRVAKVGDGQHQSIFRVRSLIDRNGEQGGLHSGLLIRNDTELVEAEQRFEHMFRANPAPAAICRLSDFRFCRVNQGFLELTGFKENQVVGRSVYEVDVLRQAEQRAAAIEHLHAGETIRQREACLDVPADSNKWVIVAGHPIDMPGDTRCMLFTFADLEARRKAEIALKQSEERFAKAFQLTPVPTLIGKRAGLAISGLNDSFTQTFGHHLDDCLGKTAAEIGLWIDPKLERRFDRELKRAGAVRNFDGRLRAKDGSELDCMISAESVTIDGEACVLCTLQDITERRRSEKDLIAAIEAAMSDASWFTRGVLDKLATLRQPPRPGEAAPSETSLTRREREVLKRVGHGSTDQEIAEELALSPNTVRNHVASLHRKLGVNRRSAVVVWARERGLVDAPEPKRSIRAKKR
ncbi:helix-turn-helix transcriptional regulator [Lichenihabitans sp. PAMC28606]|uniref:helix-turn-helix transcriptional regulator n=1 Tax=Lichenihabitans sp. PAMC28606 TaxID=2880932 RepID=UPI001D09FA74|nr:helix-turn-helix transcriptional regulator [Lichenihabitans sp. PAMC28606]UDL93668.1 helix-turn-helix transcriptional regulator [Lichenihabitans sp. PAMC28606]